MIIIFIIVFVVILLVKDTIRRLFRYFGVLISLASLLPVSCMIFSMLMKYDKCDHNL